MTVKAKTVLTLVLVIPFFLAGVAAAEMVPAGKVEIQTTAIAVGIGVDWGEGTLTLNSGEKHKFSIVGMKVIGVGFTKVNAKGTVYNLKELSDFEGRYIAAEAGIALAGGGKGTAMENQNGVVIHLGAIQQGVDLTFGVQGIHISLIK